jgi:hypothetical protein
MVNKETGEVIPDTSIHNSSSKMYQVTHENGKMNMPPFSVEMFEDAGKAMGNAFLDYIGESELSRIPKTI